MKRSIFGSRRSMRICASPPVGGGPLPVDLGLSFFRKAIGPLVVPSMLKRPMRVSFITSPADMPQTIASQCSRRAFNAGRTGRKWSSMNSIIVMTMSPVAMSSRARSRAAGSSPHSEAACTLKDRPGSDRASVRWARCAALAR